MKWQNVTFALVVVMMAAAVIPNADAIQIARPTIAVKLTGDQKVSDARNNLVTGNVTFVGNSQAAVECNTWCKIKSLFNLQSINTPNELPSGSVAKVGDFLEPPYLEGSTHYTKGQIYNYVNTLIIYKDLDGQVHSGYFPRGTSIDLRPLDPLYGNPEGLKTVITSVPSNPLFPTPANCNWILNSADGSGDLNCGTSGFLQVGQSDTYSITVDTSNGLDAEITNYGVVYAKDQVANITIRVENRIAEGILGGLILQEKSITYTTGINITTLDAVPLKKGNNTFTISVPTSQLGYSQIQIIPYVRIDVPYVSLEPDSSVTSGSGLRPVQRTTPWFGSSDKAFTIDYQVLFGEQIGPQKESSKPYVSPYSRLSFNGTTINNASTSASHSTNYILLGLGIVAAFGIGYLISRRNN